MAALKASTLRSRLVLELAAELVGGDDTSIRLAEVFLGEETPLRLSASSTIEGMRQVAERKLDLAIANPSSALTLAVRGRGPFERPQPLRAIAVIPSPDQYVFAVKSDLGVRTFEDIAVKRPVLNVLTRGTPGHLMHYMVDDIVAAGGFVVSDIEAWGGQFRREGAVPYPDGPKFEALARGEVNAIFDEAAPRWVDAALDAGMTILPLAEATVQKLEALGYRRAVLRKETYRKLPADVLTIDFSGWPLFVHSELPDERVTQICAAIEARKDVLPWQEDGPMPLAEMCGNTDAAPLPVPFHPAAERYWRRRGYLK